MGILLEKRVMAHFVCRNVRFKRPVEKRPVEVDVLKRPVEVEVGKRPVEVE